MPTEDEKIVIRAALSKIRNPAVVELGAHTGEEESWIRAACDEDPLYVMVEPDVRNVQRILDDRQTMDRNHRRIFIGAIADYCGLISFLTSRDVTNDAHGSGSIKTPTAHLSMIPNVVFEHQTVVPCITLDVLFEREWLFKIDLLYVDIQGAELDMIRGGKEALSRTRWLFIEATTTAMYSGAGTRADILTALGGDWAVVAAFDDNVLLHNSKFREVV